MLSRLRSWTGGLLARRRLESDMNAELRQHMAKFAEDLIRSGVPRAEAERRAKVEFGSLAAAKEECRQAKGLFWLDEVARNLRFALRTFRKNPTFTVTAIATLALCIGANTAIYSVVDAVLLKPLPYPEPERLANLSMHVRSAEAEEDRVSHSGKTWETVRDQLRSVDVAVFSAGLQGISLVSDDHAEYVRQQRVSTGFFRVLGVSLFLGREFTPEEDQPEGPRVAILNHALWQRLFPGKAPAIGKSVLLRGEPHTIVGVTPPEFQSNVPAALWTPLRPSTSGEGAGTNYRIIARLRQDTTWPRAQTEARIAMEPSVRERNPPPGIDVNFGFMPLQEGSTQSLRRPLFLLWGAVAMVLLVGCVNIAGLMLARVSSRQREIATRIALGGGRMAVLRQLLTESLVLALLGGVAGVGIGYAGVKALELLGQQQFGVSQSIELSGRVLAATFVIAIGASLMFGLAPAIQACRFEVRSGLAETSSRVAGGRRHWGRRLLATGELTLVMMLLIGAGLLVRTYTHLLNLDPGFDPTNVFTAQVPLAEARYTTGAPIQRLFDESLARLRALPGIEAAAVGLTLPYQRALNTPFGRPGVPREQTPITSLVYASPDYFEALRIPLLRGRVFADTDQPRSTKVVLVNRAFVERYFQKEEPLHAIVTMGSEDRQIVGIVGDVQQRPGWGSSAPLWPSPTVYMPANEAGALLVAHTWFEPSFTNGNRWRYAARRRGCRSAAALRRLPYDG